MLYIVHTDSPGCLDSRVATEHALLAWALIKVARQKDARMRNKRKEGATTLSRSKSR